MSLRILFVAATEFEADVLKEIPGLTQFSGRYKLGDNELYRVVTGVGSVSTAWSMKQWLSMNPKPHLALNIGIAGSYRDEISVGEIVMPVSDCFADLGIETDKGFLTLSEAGLTSPDNFPFKNGSIIAENEFVRKAFKYVKAVRAITVNTASGSEAAVKRLTDKYDPDIETMEGAAFFYVSAMEKIPFMGIRAISNRAGPRKDNKWNIEEAVSNLSKKIKEIIVILD